MMNFFVIIMTSVLISEAVRIKLSCKDEYNPTCRCGDALMVAGIVECRQPKPNFQCRCVDGSKPTQISPCKDGKFPKCKKSACREGRRPRWSSSYRSPYCKNGSRGIFLDKCKCGDGTELKKKEN